MAELIDEKEITQEVQKLFDENMENCDEAIRKLKP